MTAVCLATHVSKPWITSEEVDDLHENVGCNSFCETSQAFSVHAVKNYRAVAVQLYWQLTLALNGGEQSVSCPDCWTSGKRALVPHGLSGSIKEKKMSFPCQEFNTLKNDDLGLIQACHQVIYGVYVSGQRVQLQLIFCSHSLILQQEWNVITKSKPFLTHTLALHCAQSYSIPCPQHWMSTTTLLHFVLTSHCCTDNTRKHISQLKGTQ
jgi:hypothetical protein